MKNKWIWIIALIVVLILAGIAAVIVLNRDGNGNNGSNNNETSTITIGTIKVPGNDSATKVIFTHPPELAGKWEKPTVSALEIEISGQITNISDRNVSFDMYFLFDGQTGDYMFPQTLRPGETVKIVKNQMIASGWGKKVLEIKATIQKPTTTVPPAITPPPTTTPPSAETPETQIFTSTPKNPQSPEEVIAAFFFYAYGGDYQKAIKLLEQEKPGLSTYKEVEAKMKSFPRELKSIEIDNEVLHINGDKAIIGSTANFKNGSDYTTATLVKEDGKWKVSLSNFD